MAPNRVRLYQDIDCCLNASHNARPWRDKENPEDLGGYERGFAAVRHDDRGVFVGAQYAMRYKMEWNSRLIAALNELDVDWVWATTWREDARGVGSLMGLTPRNERVLHPISGQTTFPSIEWKWAAILQEQELDPSPFIAVDDEWDDVTVFMREALESLGGLLISPDPNLGITPADVQKMRKYIETH